MDWLLAAVLLAFGAICGAVMRLPIFGVVMLAAAGVVLFASWAQGVWAGLLQAVIAVLLLQVGYVAGVVLRSMARPLRGRQGEPGKAVRSRAVHLPNEPKQR